MIESCDLIIRQAGHPERVIKLQEGVTRLGRAEDNDIVLSDVGVSRRHSRLILARDQVRVEDLGSGNGTYYRGFRIQNQQIEDGDELIIDPFVLQFRIRGTTAKTKVPLPEPATGTNARLDVVSGSGLARTSYPIGTRGLTIGRSETRDVVIPDPAASRHHCSILQRENGWVLRDMGSANGVFVNGNRVRESALTDGDRIRIGNTEMRFVLGDATQADSTTQRVAADPWGETQDQFSADDMSLPHAEMLTPPDRRRSRGSTFGRILVGGLGVLTAFFVMFVAVFALLIGGWVVMQHRDELVTPALVQRAPTAPTWKLQLPGGLPAADVKTLQDQGMQALRGGNNKLALQNFYRVLEAEPGKPSAERLAFAAGEYLVLESLQDELKTAAEKKRARDVRKTELLADLDRPQKRKAALDALEADYRDDSDVAAKAGWGPSPTLAQAQADLASASEAADANRWADAVKLYTKVLDGTKDPTWQKTALTGLKSARRELAREVATEWRAGSASEVRGDLPDARSHYQKVLTMDPQNPSARIHLARLGT